MRGRPLASASQKARLCTPGSPNTVVTPASASRSSTRPAVVSSLTAPAWQSRGMSPYVTRNPADLDDVVVSIELAGAGDITAAAARARAAQRGWASVPAPVRGRVIAQVGRLVEDNKQALAALVTREVGKPYAEALGE